MNGATAHQAVDATAPVRLHPKEHGAYAIVGVPLVVALAIGGLNSVAVLVTIATIAGFIANEPLMVLSGRRGERARLSTPSALWTLEVLLLITVISGGSAFWLGSEKVQAALIACTFFAVAGFAISVAGWQRAFIAQLTGIVGLTLPSAVVLLAGGIDTVSVVGLSAAWIIGRVATTTAVRSVVAFQKTSTHHQVPRINDIVLATVVLGCAAGFFSGVSECLLITPLIASAIYLRLQPPLIRHMRQIGYSLLAANCVSGLLMIVWFGTNWPVAQ
ncbi:MAG: YwiC-like family protein [Fuerstiella sp.]|nr:YwiC-like family protein [Fuerstiella sp.]MCP4783918.1 YwiC-like family protein [Fuerstiella sp.]MCP4858598.1 YwiC-like family protein [Fuerstiella sp.]